MKGQRNGRNVIMKWTSGYLDSSFYSIPIQVKKYI